MKLEDIVTCLDYKITGGGEFYWDCYPDGRYLDFDSDHGSVSVVFSTVDQTVYEITATSTDTSLRPYRWINSDFTSARKEESESKGVDDTIAFDDVKWVDIDIEEDFLEKAKAIFNGYSFDERVQVPLNIPDDELFRLMKLAHDHDVTLNEMIEMVLVKFIEADEGKKKSKGKK